MKAGPGFTHPPTADHLLRQFGGLLDVIGRTGADTVEDDLFGDPSTKSDGQLGFQLVFIPEVALFGQKPGHAGGSAAGNDGDLVDRIRSGDKPRHQGMAPLVIGRGQAVFFFDDLGFSFKAHVDLVLGVLEIDHVQPFFVAFGCDQSGFIDQVFEVGTGKTRCALGQDECIDIRGNGGALHVHAQDFFTAPNIRQGNHHLPIETARTQQGGIEDIGAVGG